MLNYLRHYLDNRGVDTTKSEFLSRDCIEPEKPPDGLVMNFSQTALDAGVYAWREVHLGERPTSFEGWSALEFIIYSRSETAPWYPRGKRRRKCSGSGGGRRRRRRRSRAAKDSVYKPRQFFTAEEEQAVKDRVERYGLKWAVIRDSFDVFKKNGRLDADIKNKWRNMVKKDPTLVESVRAPVPAAPPAPAPATPAEEEEDDEVPVPAPALKRSRIASQYAAGPRKVRPRRGRTFRVRSLAECLASDNFSILEKWTLEHASKPYPTSQEKQNLAERCCIERGSVDQWFQNMRKRKFFHLERGSRLPEDAFETQLLAFMRAGGMKPPAVPVVAAAPERARRVVTPAPVAPPANEEEEEAALECRPRKTPEPVAPFVPAAQPAPAAPPAAPPAPAPAPAPAPEPVAPPREETWEEHLARGAALQSARDAEVRAAAPNSAEARAAEAREAAVRDVAPFMRNGGFDFAGLLGSLGREPRRVDFDSDDSDDEPAD